MTRIVRAAMAVIAFTLVMSAGVLPATAEPAATCTTSVVDSTDDRVLDVSQIDEAVQTVNDDFGVDLYVRAFQATPNGSLDAYWAQSIKDCANWRKGTADEAYPKGNIAIILFSMDRKSAIFYGPGYNSLIGDARATQIREEMGDFFGAGDFTGGILHAVDAIGAEVDPSQPEPAPVAPAKPINWAAVGAFFAAVGWIMGGIVLLVVLFFVIRAIVRRIRDELERKEALATMRAAAIEAKAKATPLFTKWTEDIKFLSVESDKELQQLPRDMRKPHEDKIRSLTEGVDQNLSWYANAKAFDPSRADLPLDEYRHMRSTFEDIAGNFKRVDGQLRSIREAIAADLRHFSYEGQLERLAFIRPALADADNRLAVYGRFFDVSKLQAQTRKLNDAAEEANQMVIDRSDQQKSHRLISELEAEASVVGDTLPLMEQALPLLSDPLSTLIQKVDDATDDLDRYTKVETNEALEELEELRLALGRRTQHSFGPNRSLESQLAEISNIDREIESILDPVKEADKKRKKKAEAKRRERERSSSYGSSSSDALTGAAIGYVIGSSSRSSSSSSSSDYGGGSSGSFGGGFGGGSFGGGSSGGW